MPLPMMTTSAVSMNPKVERKIEKVKRTTVLLGLLREELRCEIHLSQQIREARVWAKPFKSWFDFDEGEFAYSPSESFLQPLKGFVVVAEGGICPSDSNFVELSLPGRVIGIKFD